MSLYYFYISGFLRDYRRDYERDPTLPALVKSRPFFRRALFTVGLLLRHFDFTDKDVIQGLDVSLHLFMLPHLHSHTIGISSSDDMTGEPLLLMLIISIFNHSYVI
jgi:hypothetical protein